MYDVFWFCVLASHQKMAIYFVTVTVLLTLAARSSSQNESKQQTGANYIFSFDISDKDCISYFGMSWQLHRMMKPSKWTIKQREI